MIDAILWAAAAVTGLPLVVYSIEVAVGLPRGSAAGGRAGDARAVVLVPAHDEEAGIGRTVADLIADAPAGTRILVVADNCSDGTAAEARRAGAEAIERHDPARRGKGYALAFGRDRIAADAPDAVPDVVIVVDADCSVAPGTIARLIARAHATGEPVQAVYLLERDLDAPPLVQISSFAMLVKNLIRSRGVFRIGGTSLLTGTGMAFPWAIFRDAALATGNIVEDMELGIELTVQGRHVLLEPAGLVLSPPAHVDDLREQRRRWEFGYFASARRWAVPMLLRGLAGGSRSQIALGLHMLVPPLASLFIGGAAVVAGLALFAIFGLSPWPMVALSALLALAGAMTVLAWSREGRSTLTGAALLAVPRYLLWKLPMYFGGGPKQWVRTTRR